MRLFVPFAAGGVADSLARELADEINQRDEFKVVVDNKPGAGGIIASNTLLKSKPTELNLLLGSTTQFINQMVSGESSKEFESYRGIDYSILIAEQDSFLVVKGNSGIRTYSEFTHRIRDKEEVTFGSLGKFSVGHILCQTLANQLGKKSVHVPYNGSPSIIQGIISGDLDYSFMAYENFKSYLADDLLAPVLVSSRDSSTLLPAVPRASTYGLKELDRGTWFYLAHQKTNTNIKLTRLLEVVFDSLTNENFKARISKLGLRPSGLRGEKLGSFLSGQSRYWTVKVEKLRQ